MTVTASSARTRTRGLARLDRVTALRLAGAALGLGGAVILLGIITAEALYPGYSTAANEISDLGGTRPPEALVLQPSATIFDAAMLVVGGLTLVAALLAHQAGTGRGATLPLAVLGIGAIGVGVFPGYTGAPHALFSMITFVAGGIAAISSSLAARGPIRWLFGVLGTLALVTLASSVVLGDASPLIELGIGGLERWIVYPIVVWLVAFGGYLAGAQAPGTD